MLLPMQVLVIILCAVVIVWWLNRKLTPVVQNARIQASQSEAITVSPAQLERFRSVVARGTKVAIQASIDDVFYTEMKRFVRDELGEGSVTLDMLQKIAKQEHERVPPELKGDIPPLIYLLKNIALAAAKIEPITKGDRGLIFTESVNTFTKAESAFTDEFQRR
jgi:hypothetical protein